MKIRSDFVTNSSSSSFVVYGVTFEDIGLKIIRKKCGIPNVIEMTNYNQTYNLITTIQNVLNGNGLEAGLGVESLLSAGLYGMHPNIILSKYKDKQVGEIKKLVAEEINKSLDIDHIKESDVFFYSEILEY